MTTQEFIQLCRLSGERHRAQTYYDNLTAYERDGARQSFESYLREDITRMLFAGQINFSSEAVAYYIHINYREAAEILCEVDKSESNIIFGSVKSVMPEYEQERAHPIHELTFVFYVEEDGWEDEDDEYEGDLPPDVRRVCKHNFSLYKTLF